jgi:hypothetical protein
MTPIDWLLALICLVLAIAVVILFFQVGRLSGRGAGGGASADSGTVVQLQRWAPKVDAWETDAGQTLNRLHKAMSQLESLAKGKEWAIDPAKAYRPGDVDPPGPPPDHCDFGAC